MLSATPPQAALRRGQEGDSTAHRTCWRADLRQGSSSDSKDTRAHDRAEAMGALSHRDPACTPNPVRQGGAGVQMLQGQGTGGIPGPVLSPPKVGALGNYTCTFGWARHVSSHDKQLPPEQCQHSSLHGPWEPCTPRSCQRAAPYFSPGAVRPAFPGPPRTACSMYGDPSESGTRQLPGRFTGQWL